MSVRQRSGPAAAYVLHLIPYSESSLIAEVLTRSSGRLALIARGARRPRSPQRGLLEPFRSLEISWSGGGEVKTLNSAEWNGEPGVLGGRSLMAAYYLNELLLALLPRDDPHPGLFDAYAELIRLLRCGNLDESDLRRFELCLLRELGYGIALDAEAGGRGQVSVEARYRFAVDRGMVLVADDGDDDAVRGKTLLDMGADSYADPLTKTESKALMRRVFGHLLEGRTLNSRRVFKELQEF